MAGKQRPDRVLIVSDTWQPHRSSLVRKLAAMQAALTQAGYQVEILAPDVRQGTTLVLPFQGGKRFEIFGRTRIARALKQFKPDYIHIATAGPFSTAARAVCLEENRRFTTACYARYPEHLARQIRQYRLLRGWADRLAQALAYRALRSFHQGASAVVTDSTLIERCLCAHNVAADRLVKLPTAMAQADTAAWSALIKADKPPLRPGFFKGLLYDLLIGWPLALLQWIPGLWLWLWGGKYLAGAALHLRERRMNRPKLDDFE